MSHRLSHRRHHPRGHRLHGRHHLHGHAHASRGLHPGFVHQVLSAATQWVAHAGRSFDQLSNAPSAAVLTSGLLLLAAAAAVFVVGSKSLGVAHFDREERLSFARNGPLGTRTEAMDRVLSLGLVGLGGGVVFMLATGYGGIGPDIVGRAINLV